MDVIIESIDRSIAGLISDLAAANTKEAARIHTRLSELEQLKQRYTT